MNLLEIITSLFSHNLIEFGAGQMCLASNGTSVDELTDKCESQLFGYLPTYEELIRPGPVVSLFDRFNVDICEMHHCADSVNPIRDYVTVGLCQLRNGTPEEFTKFIRRHHNQLNPESKDWREFPLETLIVARKAIDMKVIDIRDNNRLGMRLE